MKWVINDQIKELQSKINQEEYQENSVSSPKKGLLA